MVQGAQVQQEKKKAKRSIISESSLQLIDTMPSEARCWLQRWAKKEGQEGELRHHLYPSLTVSGCAVTAVWE